MPSKPKYSVRKFKKWLTNDQVKQYISDLGYAVVVALDLWQDTSFEILDVCGP